MWRGGVSNGSPAGDARRFIPIKKKNMITLKSNTALSGGGMLPNLLNKFRDLNMTKFQR